MNVVPICEGSGGQGSGSRTFGSESFGADITGVDLANLTDDTFEAIYRAWQLPLIHISEPTRR